MFTDACVLIFILKYFVEGTSGEKHQSRVKFIAANSHSSNISIKTFNLKKSQRDIYLNWFPFKFRFYL